MTAAARPAPLAHPNLPYVAPFLVYIALLALERIIPVSQDLAHGARLVITASLILLLSRHLLSFRFARPLQSVLCGVAVFAIWAAPDALWPAYRSHWLFQNSLMGVAATSIHEAYRNDPAFRIIRLLSTVLAVPVIEELFWRGWLMRWLIRKDFLSVPVGAYAAESFWITAVLFASEHGSYWEVGLAAGVIYNWWPIHTRSLADCILAHAVTNLCLAVFVLSGGHWHYWL